MLRDEGHQAIIYAVDVVDPMLDHIFVHRTDGPPASEEFADLLFHVDLAEIVGHEEFVGGQRQDKTAVIVIHRAIDDYRNIGCEDRMSLFST